MHLSQREIGLAIGGVIVAIMWIGSRGKQNPWWLSYGLIQTLVLVTGFGIGAVWGLVTGQGFIALVCGALFLLSFGWLLACLRSRESD